MASATTLPSLSCSLSEGPKAVAQCSNRGSTQHTSLSEKRQQLFWHVKSTVAPSETWRHEKKNVKSTWTIHSSQMFTAFTLIGPSHSLGAGQLDLLHWDQLLLEPKSHPLKRQRLSKYQISHFFLACGWHVLDSGPHQDIQGSSCLQVQLLELLTICFWASVGTAWHNTTRHNLAVDSLEDLTHLTTW